MAIVGTTGSGIRTAEGFAVGGTEADFLSTYQPWAIMQEETGETIYHATGQDQGARRAVAIRATFDPTRHATELLITKGDVIFIQPPTIVRPGAPSDQPEPVAVGPYQAEPGWRQALASEVRSSLASDVRTRTTPLTYEILVPDHITFQVRASVGIREMCGVGRSPCMEFTWTVPNTHVRILEGPAGCCLDFARPDAVRDIEIREGVYAQFMQIEPKYGGSILWWSEEVRPGRGTYIAISGPLLGRDELIKIARSMHPLDP